MDNSLIEILTANVRTASAEVSRTYTNYITKKKQYDEILSYEAELDRQRLEKISQSDVRNADILSSQLRDQVRPSRERLGQETTAALNEYNAAKDNLEKEKSKLSSAEKDYYTAILQAEASKQALEAETTQVAQKNSRTIMVVGVVLLVVAIGSFIYFKYFKK